ncbi:MAG: PH domain-containing protein [Ruminococcus sp.]|nr:PH domain-containing protein [Ruminococcus sp.]
MGKNDINHIWTDKKRTVFGLPWTFTRYYLTETKFITKTGFFNISEDEMDLYKITDKKILRPFGQRIFGCGSIIIYSRDTDTPTKEIHCIKDVRAVSNLIDEYMNKMRDKYSIRGRDLMGIYTDSEHSENTDGDYRGV